METRTETPSGTVVLIVMRNDVGNLHIVPNGAGPAVDGACPVNPGATAHDLLEHQNGLGAIGSMEEELQASGAAWFIRGHPSDFAPHDFDTLLSDITLSMSVLVRRGIRPCDYPPVSSAHDCEAFNELMRALVRACASLGPQAEVHYLAARAHVAYGYWTAVQRWNGDRQAANNQLEAIIRACIPWIASMDSGALSEGARLLLTYGNGKATLEHLS